MINELVEEISSTWQFPKEKPEARIKLLNLKTGLL